MTLTRRLQNITQVKTQKTRDSREVYNTLKSAYIREVLAGKTGKPCAGVRRLLVEYPRLNRLVRRTAFVRVVDEVAVAIRDEVKIALRRIGVIVEARGTGVKAIKGEVFIAGEVPADAGAAAAITTVVPWYRKEHQFINLATGQRYYVRC